MRTKHLNKYFVPLQKFGERLAKAGGEVGFQLTQISLPSNYCQKNDCCNAVLLVWFSIYLF